MFWIRKLLHVTRQKLDYILAVAWMMSISTKCRLSNNKKRIIAITLLEHMGDIAACEPVSRYVKSIETDAFIIWFVRKEYYELVKAFRAVDLVKTLYCLTTWSGLRKTRLFDRIVDLHIDKRVCPVCSMPHRNPDGDQSITLDNYFAHGSIIQSFSRAAGLPAISFQPVLDINESYRRRVDNLHIAHSYIVIHCKSNESCKDWRPEKWNALIDLMVREGMVIIEVGQRSDLGRNASVNYINLCGTLSIMESAEVIRRSQLFVGVDSGPAHIANAVGTYGIILLGTYRAFVRYQPFSGDYANGGNARLVYSDGPVDRLPVTTIYNEILSALANREAH